MSTILQTTAQAVQHQHTAAGVAVTTTGLGVVTWLMTNAGWMAAIAGGCLSIVLIVIQIRKGILERELLKIHIKNARRDTKNNT